MRRQHLVAWLALCLLGAILGLFLALILAAPNAALVAGPFLLEMLPHPSFYWPYPAFGVVIAGLTFYIVRLLRNSN